MNTQSFLAFQLNSIMAGHGRYLALSSALAGVLAWMMAYYENVYWVLLWLSMTVLGNGLRTLLWFRYKKSDGEFEAHKLKKLYYGTLLFSGAAWGASSFLAIGALPPELEIIHIAVLMGVQASGVVSNSAVQSMARSFVLCISISYALRILIEADEYTGAFLLFQGGFVFILFLLASRFHTQLANTYALLQEKEGLLVQLKNSFDLERQLKEEKMKGLRASKFAAIGEMAAGVGHEINNPLTIVLGYHWRMEKLMKERGADPELLGILRKSTNACQRIADIVQSMRDFSRMKAKDELEEFSLSEIMQVVRPLLKKSVANSEANLKIDISDCAVRGHKSEFAQVLYNLISNALQACEGQKGVEIEVGGGPLDERTASLWVANPGEPVEESVREKMFQPFFTTKEAGKGTGLGLSLAKTLMENNHGEVFYERGKGRNVFGMKMLLAGVPPLSSANV